jgi:hypothetical protein
MSTESNKEFYQTVGVIAEALGETKSGPLTQIKLIIKLCGEDFAYKLLQEAQTIYAEGGMLTSNGERPRTLGGIYFYLARQQVPKEHRSTIFISQWKRAKLRREREEQKAAKATKTKPGNDKSPRQNPVSQQPQLDQNPGPVQDRTSNSVPVPDQKLDEITLKLARLQETVDELRAKIAAQEASGKKSGLMLMQTMLRNAEREMKTLQKMKS